MSDHVADAEIVENLDAASDAAVRLDSEMAERAAKVVEIFDAESRSIEEILRESDKRHGYSAHMTRLLLKWLEERGRAKPKLRGGVVYWGKPVDVRKLVDVAAGLADVVAGPVEAMGGEKAARVMREAASAARSVAPAVAGIKKEAAPIVSAFKKLGDAAKEAGIFRIREPLEISVQKKQEAKK